MEKFQFETATRPGPCNSLRTYTWGFLGMTTLKKENPRILPFAPRLPSASEVLDKKSTTTTEEDIKPSNTHKGHRGSGNVVASLKLTASSQLKMDGWKMILCFWDAIFFRCELLVSGRVYIYTYYAAWLKEGRTYTTPAPSIYLSVSSNERTTKKFSIDFWTRELLFISQIKTLHLSFTVFVLKFKVGLTIHATYVSSDTSDKVLIQVLDISSNHKWILTNHRESCVIVLIFSQRVGSSA